jgi:hypothetical protein
MTDLHNQRTAANKRHRQKNEPLYTLISPAHKRKLESLAQRHGSQRAAIEAAIDMLGEGDE